MRAPTPAVATRAGSDAVSMAGLSANGNTSLTYPLWEHHVVADPPDWLAWHAQYDDPQSPLSRRLRVVQGRLSEWLDEHEGAVRVVSACAGDGRDVIEVLGRRPDAERVSAVLIEWDPRNADAARRSAQGAGL